MNNIEAGQLWSSSGCVAFENIVEIIKFDEKKNIVQFKRFGMDQLTVVGVDDFLSKYKRIWYVGTYDMEPPSDLIKPENKHPPKSKWRKYEYQSETKKKNNIFVEREPKLTIGSTLGYINIPFYNQYCKGMKAVLVFFHEDEIGFVFLKEASPGSLKIGEAKGPGHVFSTRGIYTILEKLLPKGKKLIRHISSMTKEVLDLDGVKYDLWKAKVWK